MNKIIDKMDLKIIELLKIDGRMPNTEIAKHLKKSESNIRKRLKRLTSENIIKIGATINYSKMGNVIEGNLRIKVDSTKFDHVKESLYNFECIQYMAHMMGEADFLVDFLVNSQDELLDFENSVRRIDGVRSIESSILLEMVKVRYDLVGRFNINQELKK